MTVTAIRKDPDALTMTVNAEFDAPADRVWQLWADPRQLERWWMPTYPATVDSHDLRPGGRVAYHIPGPRRPAEGLLGDRRGRGAPLHRLPRRIRQRRRLAEHRHADQHGPRHDR